MSDKLELHVIKTNKGCFISDCNATNGYDYNYHRSRVKDLYFDGKLPEESYLKNWYFINKYPNKIEVKENDKQINKRYTLINKEMESKALPLELDYDELDYEDSTYDLYELEYDIKKGGLKELTNVDIQIICEVEDFTFPPNIEYRTTQKIGWDKKEIKITNANIEHQMLDKMIFPQLLLHNRPCKISSVEFYHIVRQHVKDNIDTKYAKITSDYDFCFEVNKLIPLSVPKKFNYTNPFASTKKQRSKIHTGVRQYKESSIFEMTHTQSNYQSYTPLQPVEAMNEDELKEKIDTYLENLINYINEPLVECEHCQGNGWVNEIKKFETNQQK